MGSPIDKLFTFHKCDNILAHSTPSTIFVSQSESCMREVWELIGPNWRLPLGVEMRDQFICRVRLGCGIALLKKQRAAAEPMLDHAADAREGSTWFIHKAVLMRIAQISTAEPEDVVVWGASVPKDDTSEDGSEF